MTYHTGDVPREAFTIEPAFDLSEGDTATAKITDPEGAETVLTASVDQDENTVQVQWPDVSLFTLGGIYEIRATIVNGTKHERLPTVPIIVQDDTTGWHTLDSARDQWPGAPDSDRELYELLHIARRDVTVYAPALAEGAPVPLHYAKGQLMQARNIWNSTDVQTDGESGLDSFAVKPFPLDWQIKQILRPKRGLPRVF